MEGPAGLNWDAQPKYEFFEGHVSAGAGGQ